MTPDEQLAQLLRDYPKLHSQIAFLREGRGKDEPYWPDDVLLPYAGWSALAEAYAGKPVPPGPEIYRLEALGTWKYAKGIYRFSPELGAALVDTDLPESIPMLMLNRLPDLCPYIVNPVGDDPAGWWVYLDYDFRPMTWELRIVLDDGSWRTIPLELSDMSIHDSIATYSDGYFSEIGFDAEGISAWRDNAERAVSTPLKLLLYLCSDAPDVEGRQPGERPHMERSKRVKHGDVIFEPPAVRTWKVGEKIAHEIASYNPDGHGARKRPHIRRAHWHGFWSGPRSDPDARSFSFRWIPPIYVNEDLAESDGNQITS